MLAVLRGAIGVALVLAVLPSPASSSGAVPCQGQRALVLGGGGVTGYAWEIGLLKRLHDAGMDLADADLIVGTSAGGLLAAQLATGQSLDDLYEAIHTPRRGGGGSAPSVDIEYLLDTFRIWQDADPSAAQRFEVGRRALDAAGVVSEEDQIGFVTRNFGVTDWPNRPLVIMATDTADGAPRLFDASQGVSIERALAAGIALPVLDAPITIDGDRYMDGGVSGSTHFDVAAGYACVVGITPGGGPLGDREADALEASGSRVLRVSPDADSTAARGFNISDQSRAPDSAEAGLRQAESVASEVRQFWGSSVTGESR